MSIPAKWSMITLEDRVVTVPPGVVLDLGATAKAIAADRCADRVRRVTGSGVLINLGGDIATAGPAPDGGWQVLVHDDADDPAGSVALPSGAALATSSTIRRRWRRDGDVVHHILDPRTGWSADPVWRTVSVAAQTCLAANTVSTAAIIRGWRALDWIRALGFPARLVDSERNVHTICGWPSNGEGARQ
jgi:thiamine biosynthesis lipoprotein